MPEPLFTLKEVARHNGKIEAAIWIIIKDTVYDVTNYLKSHPGGTDLLLEYAGKDATAGFNDFGHSSDAKRTLKSFKIGLIIEEDRAINRSRKSLTIHHHAEEFKEARRRKMFIPFFQKCVN